MVAEHGLFYLYDSIAGGDSINTKQHRALLANLSKRSRYYVVNPGLIDRPEIRGSQIEVGNRYFEGAAAGAIMIGEFPCEEEFGKLFDWAQGVVDLPYDSSNIQAKVKGVDQQPERQEKIRRRRTAYALTKHDWVY